MWFEALVIGLLVGIFRGGRIANLAQVRLRGVIVLALGLIVQLVPFFLHGIALVKQQAAIIIFIGVLITIGFVVINIRIPGMVVVFIGTLLNAVVLYFHQFKMPIALNNTTNAAFAQMKLAITAGDIANYSLMSQSTHLTKYLGKIILMPDFYPFTPFFGIPDIAIALGVIWLLQAELADNIPDYGRGTYYRSYRKHY